jgi:hypothetical protein
VGDTRIRPIRIVRLWCKDGQVRTTVTISEEVLELVKVRAARQGKREVEVIEESLRFGLGRDLLDGLWSKNKMSESQAMRLAVEAQHSTRHRRGR